MRNVPQINFYIIASICVNSIIVHIIIVANRSYSRVLRDILYPQLDRVRWSALARPVRHVQARRAERTHAVEPHDPASCLRVVMVIVVVAGVMPALQAWVEAFWMREPARPESSHFTRSNSASRSVTTLHLPSRRQDADSQLSAQQRGVTYAHDCTF
jgi:hypothetical protein